MTALVASFEGIEIGEPVDDPYEYAFDFVTRMPIGALAKGKRAALGIYITGEQKNPKTFPLVEVFASLVFEVHVTRDVGESLPDVVEDLLLVVERKLMEDQTVGGLALDINIRNLTIDIDGPFDNSAAATLEAVLHYRHNLANPSIPV